jgi:hypothetical protein
LLALITLLFIIHYTFPVQLRRPHPWSPWDDHKAAGGRDRLQNHDPRPGLHAGPEEGGPEPGQNQLGALERGVARHHPGEYNTDPFDFSISILNFKSFQCEDTPNRIPMKIGRAVEEVNKLLVPQPEGEDELKRKQLME